MLNFHLQKKLRHFTIEIDQQIGAETLVLIGHSGCGKSTTLHMLAGLLTPDHGHIELGEHTLWQENAIHLPPEQRRIGYLFQNYALFPHLSVADNVSYGLSRLEKKERDARVAEALNLLNLEPLTNAKPASLSGGEQQRVALARAIVTRPRLLLLDEPLSALDVSLRSHVRGELKTLLKKLAIPTLIVTHDYEDARVLADRIAVMHRGKIIQTGTPAAIAKAPANHFVAEFVGTNFLCVPNEKAGEGRRTEREARIENAAGIENETRTDHDMNVADQRFSYLAFDPWRVTISRSTFPTEEVLAYQWRCRIHDIARLGGYVRLTLETVGEKDKQQLLADLLPEQLEQQEQTDYQLGETVYASIARKEVRNVQTNPVIVQMHRQSQQTNGESNTPTKPTYKSPKWLLPTVLLFVTIILSITGYALYQHFLR